MKRRDDHAAGLPSEFQLKFNAGRRFMPNARTIISPVENIRIRFKDLISDLRMASCLYVYWKLSALKSLELAVGLFFGSEIWLQYIEIPPQHVLRPFRIQSILLRWPDLCSNGDWWRLSFIKILLMFALF